MTTQEVTVRLVKRDEELVDFIINKLNLKDSDKDSVLKMVRYNILTVLQVSELTGLRESTITNKSRPQYKGNELVTELDLCYPFKTLRAVGPKFIVRNEKLELLLWKEVSNTDRLTFKEKLLRTMYSNQKKAAEKREMDPPSYSFEEFKVWMLANPDYDRLYEAWAESGYNKKLVPTCDRKENDISYTLDNLRVVTFEENIIMGGKANMG